MSKSSIREVPIMEYGSSGDINVKIYVGWRMYSIAVSAPWKNSQSCAAKSVGSYGIGWLTLDFFFSSPSHPSSCYNISAGRY